MKNSSEKLTLLLAQLFADFDKWGYEEYSDNGVEYNKATASVTVAGDVTYDLVLIRQDKSQNITLKILENSRTIITKNLDVLPYREVKTHASGLLFGLKERKSVKLKKRTLTS